ncbi:hypothetical protein [Rickettsia endosymbiont of Urophora cardui]|uniref:hypothetical protein n=1 Tax=Rickettsia endosymbiont of Urophora cardui TaxID=3066265 RepID=UPI00313D6680
MQNDQKLQKLIRLLFSRCRPIVSIDDRTLGRIIDYLIYNKNDHSYSLEIAEIILTINPYQDALIASLLSSFIDPIKEELYDLKLDIIRDDFGIKVANIIQGIIQLSKIHYIPSHKVQQKNFMDCLFALPENIMTHTLCIKLSYLLHKISIFNLNQSHTENTIVILEIIEFYLPCVQKACLGAIQNELQDICLQFLKPDEYQYITEYIHTIYGNSNKLICDVSNLLSNILHASNIHAEIIGRVKNPYSVWLKMLDHNVNLAQLYDILGIRIIVNDIEECYKALDCVHKQYQIRRGHVKDYINIPKPNGYQSLHTIVMDSSKRNIEIQIRTHAMHITALCGHAAHWQYKNQNPIITRVINNIYTALYNPRVVNIPLIFQDLVSQIAKFNFTRLLLPTVQGDHSFDFLPLKSLWYILKIQDNNMNIQILTHSAGITELQVLTRAGKPFKFFTQHDNNNLDHIQTMELNINFTKPESITINQPNKAISDITTCSSHENQPFNNTPYIKRQKVIIHTGTDANYNTGTKQEVYNLREFPEKIDITQDKYKHLLEYEGTRNILQRYSEIYTETYKDYKFNASTGDPDMRAWDILEDEMQREYSADIARNIKKFDEFLSTDQNSITSIKLSNIDINYTDIKKIVLKLQHNTTINHIDLAYTNIAPASMRLIIQHIICNNNMIKHLNLSGNYIRPGELLNLLAALKKNQSLTHLDLSRCGLDDEGAAELSEFIQDHTSLTSINIDGNIIISYGLEELTIAIESNRLIRSIVIDLSSHKIEPGIRYRINNAIQHNMLCYDKVKEVMHNISSLCEDDSKYDSLDAAKLLNFYQCHAKDNLVQSVLKEMMSANDISCFDKKVVNYINVNYFNLTQVSTLNHKAKLHTLYHSIEALPPEMIMNITNNMQLSDVMGVCDLDNWIRVYEM